MKTKIYLLSLLVTLLCGCDQYLVPNDFPLQEFYSYAPYQEGQIIKLESETETIEYKVTAVEESYNRGRVNCKCGKESVDKTIIFESNIDTITLWVHSMDRAIFEIVLQSNKKNALNAAYRVDYSNEDIWTKSYDNTKIFKDFTNECILSQNERDAALIKKNEGILWITTNDDTNWRVSK